MAGVSFSGGIRAGVPRIGVPSNPKLRCRNAPSRRSFPCGVSVLASTGHVILSTARAAAIPFIVGMLPPLAWADRQPAVTPVPPIARTIPHTLEAHGDTRDDPWYWMRDDSRSNPELLAWLAAENAYVEASLAHTRPMQEMLVGEMAARVDLREETVPWRKGRFWYRQRYRAGADYPVILRSEGTPGGAETEVLDLDALAQGQTNFELGTWEISGNGNLVAWTEDTTGGEVYTLRVKDLVTGETLADRVTGTDSDFAWANDNRTLYYLGLDDALRPLQVFRHRVGTAQADDELVYEEHDTTFELGIGKSRDDKFIQVSLVSTLSAETRLIDANRPDAKSVAFLPREPDHRYEVDIDGADAFVVSNWQAPNYRLMRVPLDRGGDKSAWTEVVPGQERITIREAVLFRDFIVLHEVHGPSLALRVIARDGTQDYVIDAKEAAYSAWPGENREMDATTLRYTQTSFTTPKTEYDFDMKTRSRTLLRRAFAGADFKPGMIESRVITATARDGTRIPVSLMYRRGTKPDGTHPLFLRGYGAYADVGYVEFDSDLLSLVNRGFVYAFAHTRGGGEFGRAWYDQGRLLKKKNTFTDFIDAADYLTTSGWAAPGRLAGFGRSAGGLLIGAVANMSPGSFGLLLTEAPFVDVVTTMQDDTVPLTSYEWEEWGDPRVKTHYDYMLSYSPYDQVRATAYPDMMVTTALWDSRVGYWEPAKWVARLRATKTGDQALYLHTDLGAGHAGRAGRFTRLGEIAMEFAFILDRFGVEP